MAEQGKRPSSPLEAEKTGLFLTCGGKLIVPLEWRRVSLETWSFVKHVKNPFEFQGKRGLSLETLQRKRASSSVQGRISWVVWSCGGKLRVPLELRVNLVDPLVFPQRSQISVGVERGTSGFLVQLQE